MPETWFLVNCTSRIYSTFSIALNSTETIVIVSDISRVEINQSHRCYRLNKDCQSAPAVRQKRVSKRPASILKTTVLEEKLDGIVQMLQRSQAPSSETRQGRGQILNESVDPRASSGVQDENQISQRDGSEGAIVGYSGFSAANDRPSIGGKRLDETAQPHGLTNRSKFGRDGFVLYPANGPPLTPATSIAGRSTMADGPEIPVDYPLESEAELQNTWQHIVRK